MPIFLTLGVAYADVATPTETETEACTEGDACTTDDGEAGTCDADGACVAAEESSGCSTTGLAAGSVTLFGVSLLALRRRQR